MFLTNKSTDREDYQRIQRRISAMPKEFPKGFYNAPHQHERVQLVYGITGIMELYANGQIWILSPKTALLIPENTEHSMLAITNISLRTLYIKPEILNSVEDGYIKLIKVDNFLKELIERSTLIPVDYVENSIDGKIMDIIMHELKFAEEIFYSIPSPTVINLIKVESMIMQDNLLLKKKVDYWSKLFCMSTKTLNRLILKDLGVTFNTWRQYLSVKISLIQMSDNKSLTNIAYGLGYQSPSNFCRMFKNITGQNPSLFIQALK
ncbi:AraC family transcriptional regulator [Acinetobacter sp. CE-15]|uniref:AraC family transcriptional regulator n=1 Tax=Acinetobacter sp. CE-15 TaxID=3425693 RepID=UPI003DA5A510